MDGLTLYVHPTWTSCKKAQAALTEGGIPFARRDYFKERFTVEELRALLAAAGLAPRDVLSRRSRGYKELIGDREATLTDEELLALMVQEPTLLRRPLAVRGGEAVVGFDAAALAALAEGKHP